MKLSFFFFSALLTASALQAQDNVSTADKEAAYTRTINNRAAKIVSALHLPDTKKEAKISELVAAQYRALNTVYTARDLQVKTTKETLAANKDALDAKLKSIEEETTSATKALHTSFLQALATELNAAEIEKIKDGMTYGVLPLTYNAYLDMLPDLTGAQKTQILQWLTEARENAMDAGSSEKKHWWFGKYKGRINNYLSAAGYDMKKEGEAWQKRIAERKKQSGS